MRIRFIRAALACAVALAMSGCANSPTAASVSVANFNGTWGGNYSVSGCSQSGDFATANFCSIVTGNLPFSLQVASGASTFTLGSLTFSNGSASVAGSALTATGATTTTDASSNVTFNISVTWTVTESNSQLAGTLVQTWTGSGFGGQALVQGTILAPTSHTTSLDHTNETFRIEDVAKALSRLR